MDKIIFDKFCHFVVLYKSLYMEAKGEVRESDTENPHLLDLALLLQVPPWQ